MDWVTQRDGHVYHTLLQCLDGDVVIAGFIVFLCLTIFIGYLRIALFWLRCMYRVTNKESQKALRKLIYIFIFCGISSYLWTVIKILFPGWIPYVLFLGVLNYYTWSFNLRKSYFSSIDNFFREHERIVESLIDRGRNDK